MELSGHFFNVISIFLNSIPNSLYGIIGVVIGFCLNIIKDNHDRKPRLYYSLCEIKMEDGWKYEQVTKTGPSGYYISIYNCGREPVMLNNMSVHGKNQLIADALMEECVTILPYEKYDCMLSKQSFDNLLFWCKKLNLKEYQIQADTITEKTIKGKLDITLIAMQM